MNAIDKKMDLGMFFGAMKDRFKGVLASTMTPEEKLAQIVKRLEIDVQEKHERARKLGGQMRALKDPETKELEPLEKFAVQRAKLVAKGGELVGQPDKAAQLGQLSQEIKGLDALIGSKEMTYETLKQGYDLAKANYLQAFAALEKIRENGSAMLEAIAANKEALAMRDAAQNQETVDTSFLDDLQAELTGVQAELRTDQAIDDDLDATKSFSIDATLAKMDAESVDAGIMDEFKAAAKPAAK